jgi:hypothetical protein
MARPLWGAAGALGCVMVAGVVGFGTLDQPALPAIYGMLLVLALLLFGVMLVLIDIAGLLRPAREVPAAPNVPLPPMSEEERERMREALRARGILAPKG